MSSRRHRRHHNHCEIHAHEFAIFYPLPLAGKVRGSSGESERQAARPRNGGPLQRATRTAGAGVLKWLVLVAIAVAVLGLLAPGLSRMGLGRLPGDFRFRKNGREYYLPVTSTIVLSLLLTLAGRFI